MSYEPPGGWATPPPAPLLELLEVSEAAEAMWRAYSKSDGPMASPSFRERCRVRAETFSGMALDLRQALVQAYAPPLPEGMRTD